MDKAFLDIYEDELAFLRDMGAEFATTHPKIAGRLRLGDNDVRDPYVERLLEGFAFLTARVRLRIQAQYPEFTQTLLSLLYPNFTAPVPSCGVFEFLPRLSEGALSGGFTVARGAMIAGQVENEDTPCEFALARDVTLHPLAVESAEYLETPADLEAWFPNRFASGAVEAAIRIRIRVTAGGGLGALNLSELSLFVSGEKGRADHILSAVLGNADTAVVQAVDASSPARSRNPVTSLPPLLHQGFRDEEALLPISARTFSGHRLLQEAFILPEAFRFFEVGGLSPALEGRGETVFDIVVGLEDAAPELADWLDAQSFRLNCVPAVNLFSRRADRIAFQPTRSEHLVVVDRTRPHAFEVYSVNSVEGIGKSPERGQFRQTFTPVFQTTANLRQTSPDNGYFNVRREARLATADAGNAYGGTDVHLRLARPGGGPVDLDMNQLVTTTLCTNRGLAARLSNKSVYRLRATAPIDGVRALVGPTKPRLPPAEGSAGWALINALSINHLSFDPDSAANAVWLRRLLTLFTDGNDPVQKQIPNAFTGVGTRVVNRRLPGEGPISYGRGLEITVEADQARLRGTGPFVITSVLERYFQRAATINSFTQTVLVGADGKRIAKWPIRLGRRHGL